jgi:hypothetical protein
VIVAVDTVAQHQPSGSQLPTRFHGRWLHDQDHNMASAFSAESLTVAIGEPKDLCHGTFSISSKENIESFYEIPEIIKGIDIIPRLKYKKGICTND